MVPAAGGPPRSITDAFDENPGLVAWTTNGIYFSGLQKTASHLFRVDPDGRAVSRVSTPDALMAYAFSLTADAAHAGIRGGVANRAR